MAEDAVLAEITLRLVDGQTAITPTLLNELSKLQSIVSRKEVKVDKKHVLQLACSTTCLLFLVEYRGKVVGMIQAAYYPRINGPVVWIDNLAVSEELQGRGVGTHLVLELTRKASEKWPFLRGCKACLTSSPSRGTRDFYIGLGFVPREGDRTTVVYEYIIE